MTVPLVYRKSPEILANYSFSDILADVGYVVMYGLSDEADNKKLSIQAIESTDVVSMFAGTSGTVESNFDYEFNLGAKVKGDLYVTITIVAEGSASATATNTTTIEIFHVRDATETTIGTQQTLAVLSNPASTPPTEARHTCSFSVDKQFKKGDTLRIEVRSTVASANVNSFAGHYHDGANRNFTLVDQHGIAANSNLIVQVPFNLAL